MKSIVHSPQSTVIFILMFSFLLILGCQPKIVEKQKEQEIIPVKVMRVELKDISETIDYVGNIKAQDEILVYPKVSGKVAQKVKEDGSAVRKGEAIVYLDRDEVGLKFERAPVESPIDAVVGRVYVDLGTNVLPQTPVALVVNMDKVKIDLDVPERYVPFVSLGQEARISVDAYPEEIFLGKISKISPVIDLASRTALVEIIVDNPGHRLKSGMFARVNLILQTHENSPVILREALMGTEPNTYVYVIENKKAVLKKVTLGIRQGSYYEVSAGLKEKDLAVIMGQQRLYEGAEVIYEERE